MDIKIQELQNEIDAIKARKLKVELSKKWETSLERKLAIVVITYLFMTCFMYILEVDKPYINSLVPTAGYFLSTLSLEFIKKIWIKNIND